MPGMLRKIKKQHFITLLLLLLVYAGTVVCSGYSKSNIAAGTNSFSDSLLAGSASCMNCHKAIYDSFIGTAHYLTSRPAAAEFIKGSFDSGQNQFTYNQFMNVKLEKKDSGFFQTVYVNGAPTHSESMDIVVGSGKKGQTYLYWKENLLYQLPVSYYVLTKSWCNSPGYPAGMPRFNRLIPARCIECHGSDAVIEDAGRNVNYFDKASIVYGVNCERCHGPSASHVAFHLAHPQEKAGKYILNEKSLNRQQNLDLCALCHSGIRTTVKPVFSYRAGDRLEDFSLPKYNTDSVASLDVHGNQYGLLTSSKCFKNSQMTCSSCHSVHGREVNEPALYSQRCMNCHNGTAQPECKVKPTAGIVLSANCIDCHMPSLPSKAIFLQLEDPAKSTADFVRSHRIAIYPEAVRAFIKQSKAERKQP
ncbi:MAG: multiheme c-type cytochrome [Chitinophagaceae bacterium]